MLARTALVLFVCMIICLSSVLMPGCNRAHITSSADSSQLIILHTKDVNGEQFAVRYPTFGLSNPQRISRSENKWQYDWEVKASKREGILNEIKGCEEVFSVEERNDTISPPSNSTNSGHSKTKPIKNQ